MQVIINLDENQFKVFQTMGTKVDEYYHFPQWLKELGNGKYEVIAEKDLPDEVKELLPPDVKCIEILEWLYKNQIDFSMGITPNASDFLEEIEADIAANKTQL